MKPGRNDPCPCGSGKKFKKCCLGSGSYDDPFISWLRRTPREAAVSGVAALLFHGDGPWRAHSIERAACMAWLVATDSAPAAGTIDPNQLSTLLAASPLIEGWRTLDDPPESALVDAITCVGGDCLVYPGPSYEAIFALKLLFRAFGASPLESTLVGTALARAHALLLLSDAVIKSLGHTRHDFLPLDPPSGPIDARSFRITSEALTFDSMRLQRTLSPLKLPVGFVQPFICEPTPVQPDERWDDHPLLVQPLVRAGQSLVLATPGTVGSACLWHIFSSTQHSPADRQILTNAFKRASEEHLGRLLHLMGWQKLPAPKVLDDEDTPSVSNAIYCFDVDKFAHVQLIVDNGTEVEMTMAQYELSDAQLRKVEVQRTRIDEYLLRDHAVPAERVLRLVVTSGFGRGLAALSEGGDQAHALRFSLEALDVLVFQRESDPLTLWKFANALAELRQTTRLGSWSDLDIYAVYRFHGHSFYLSDDKLPTYIGIDASMSRELRDDVRRKNDFHGVALPSGNITLVTLFWGPGVRVFVPEGSLVGGSKKFLVEYSDQSSTWVYPGDSQAPYMATLELLETVAYWCWQLTAILLRRCWTLPTIRLLVHGSEAEWDDIPDEARDLSEGAGLISVTRGPQELKMEIHPAFAAAAATSDNRAERVLVRSLLASAMEGHAEPPSSSDLDALVNEVCPLGNKKKFLALNYVAAPTLWDGDLDRLRSLQEHDVARALDGVGERLAETFGVQLPWDPIPSDRYRAVFEALRQDFLVRISTKLQGLDGVKLVRMLVRLYERITHSRTFHAMATAPSLACFEGSERALEIARNAQSLDRIALTTRIAVEIVAARPPAGVLAPSDGDLDELLALVDGYSGACVLAEETRCRVYPHALSLLASGRLGIEPQPRSLAKLFWPAKRQEGIRIAVDTFERYWEPPIDRRDPVKAAELEEAFLAEFGVSLEDPPVSWTPQMAR
jgi:hypothetical protein